MYNTCPHNPHPPHLPSHPAIPKHLLQNTLSQHRTAMSSSPIHTCACCKHPLYATRDSITHFPSCDHVFHASCLEEWFGRLQATSHNRKYICVCPLHWNALRMLVSSTQDQEVSKVGEDAIIEKKDMKTRCGEGNRDGHGDRSAAQTNHEIKESGKKKSAFAGWLKWA